MRLSRYSSVRLSGLQAGVPMGVVEYGGYGDGCQGASLNGAGAKCHGLSSLLVFRGARTPESG